MSYRILCCFEPRYSCCVFAMVLPGVYLFFSNDHASDEFRIGLERADDAADHKWTGTTTVLSYTDRWTG